METPKLKVILTLIITLSLLTTIATPAQKLSRKYYANGSEVRKVFTPAIIQAQKSTLSVIYKSVRVAHAVAISKDGYAITKASQLPTHNVQLKDQKGDFYKVKVIGINYQQDIALLKAETDKFIPIKWATNITPNPGSWVITPGMHIAPIAVGMVSTKNRELRQNYRGATPMLGISLPRPGDDRARVVEVHDGTGAKQAGINKEDLITHVAGVEILGKDHLVTILKKHKAGQWVNIILKRDSRTIKKKVLLGTWVVDPVGQSGMQNALGGSLSIHRAGYKNVIQHDTPLSPENCGGPVVNLDGKAYGINIARVGRTATYILPAKTLIPIINDLKQNKNPIHTFKP